MDSAITGFMQQEAFAPLMLLTCGSAFLLLVSVVGIFYSRSRKARALMEEPPAKTKRKTTPPADMPAPEPPVDSDLPDLDMLVSTPPEPAPQPPARKRRSGTFTVDLQEGGAVEAVEVMTIMRDVVSGGLIVQIGDKAYEDMSRAPDFKSNFLKIMRELSPQVKATAPASPPPPTPEPAPETVASEEPPAEEPAPAIADTPVEPVEEVPPLPQDVNTSDSPPEPAPDESAPPATAPPTIELPGDLPRYKENEYTAFKESGGLFRRKKLEVKPIPELDIAGAIESFIQHKLAQMPQFADRSIHVLPAPDGGVSIEVDGRYYDAVGDVDDAAVREFLSTSIQEWQSRQ